MEPSGLEHFLGAGVRAGTALKLFPGNSQGNITGPERGQAADPRQLTQARRHRACLARSLFRGRQMMAPSLTQAREKGLWSPLKL